MKNTIRTLLPLTLLLLAACQTPPERRDMVQELLHHPQFPAVRLAAPEWGKTALETINDLQTENAKLRATRP